MGGLGDLSVIRNILFGQQAAEFESQFDSLMARMDKTDAEAAAQLRQLEAATKKSLEELTASVNARFQQLEEKLAQTAAQFGEKLAAASREDKAKIGNLLIEIGQKLT